MKKVKFYMWTKDEPLLIMAKSEILVSGALSKVENLGYVYIKKGDILQVLHSKDDQKGKFYVRIVQDEGMLEKELNMNELEGIEMREIELKEYKNKFKSQKQKINNLMNSWIKELEYKKRRKEKDAKNLIRQINKHYMWGRDFSF